MYELRTLVLRLCVACIALLLFGLSACKDANSITTPRIIDIAPSDSLAKKLYDTVDITPLMTIELQHNTQTLRYSPTPNNLRFLYIKDTSGRAYISATGEITKTENPSNEPGVDLSTVLFGIDTIEIGKSKPCNAELPSKPYFKPTWFVRTSDTNYKVIKEVVRELKVPRNLNSDSTKIEFSVFNKYFETATSVRPYRIDTLTRDTVVFRDRQSTDVTILLSVTDTNIVRTISTPLYVISATKSDYDRAGEYPQCSASMTPGQGTFISILFQLTIENSSTLKTLLKGKTSVFKIKASCTLP